MGNWPGRFIVIEGIDGTGKTTQSSLLVERLKKEKFQTFPVDFPQYGDNIFADTIAAYLRNEFGNASEVNPYLASLAYAADRWKAASRIRNKLYDGMIVIANRYASANMGHQGSKINNPEERERFFSWLKELEFGNRGFGIPEPDVVIFLYLKPDIAQSLVDKKAERDYVKGRKRDGHEASISYLRSTAETFLQIAKTEKNWKVVDCTDEKNNFILPPEVIHENIWKIIKEFLPKRGHETSRFV